MEPQPYVEPVGQDRQRQRDEPAKWLTDEVREVSHVREIGQDLPALKARMDDLEQECRGQARCEQAARQPRQLEDAERNAADEERLQALPRERVGHQVRQEGRERHLRPPHHDRDGELAARPAGDHHPLARASAPRAVRTERKAAGGAGPPGGLRRMRVAGHLVHGGGDTIRTGGLGWFGQKRRLRDQLKGALGRRQCTNV